MVENEFQKEALVATTYKITTTIEIIISKVVVISLVIATLHAVYGGYIR